MNKKTIYILSSFGLFFLALFLLPTIYTLCVTEKSGSEIINATVYDNSQYSLGSEGVKLTSDGADINNWNYTDSKYLQINVNVPSDNKKYIVKVSTAKELYFVTSELSAPAGFSDVSFTKNENILVNTNASYSVNDYSGTASYTIASGISSATIQLELKYDYILWNRQENSIINDDEDKALIVELQSVDGDTVTSEALLNINNATSGISDPINHSVGMTVNNVTSTTDTAEIVYDETNPDVLMFVNNFYLRSQSATNFYYKKLKIKVTMPYYEVNNKKYYLGINKDNISFTRNIGGTVNYEVDESQIDSGIVNIILYDYYVYSGTILSYEVNFPSDLDPKSASKFSFIGGKSEVYDINNDGEVLISNTIIKTINYSSSFEENVLIRKAGNFDVPYNNTSDTLVSTLGGFYLYNGGTGDSNKKHIDILFDNENTGYIKVTTMNIPVDRTQQYMSVKYRLVDDNNVLVCKDSDGNYISDNSICADYSFDIMVKNPNYSTNTSLHWNNLFALFHRGLLPEGERGYYLKEIIYDIDKIKSGSLLYAYQSEKSYTGTGNYYGFVNYNGSSTIKVNSKITVTSDGFDTLESTSYVRLISYSSSPYSITNISINGLSKQNVSVTAGNSLTLKGQVNEISYPYGTIHWMNNIAIGLALPSGVSVNDESIILKTKTNSNIKPSKVEVEDLYNGLKMWKIYVPNDVSIGYASETLTVGPNGDKLEFEMQLNTEYYMNQQTIVMNKSIFTASVKTDSEAASVNAAGGSYGWASKDDIYDLNGNAQTTDKIGGMNQSDTTSFEIVPQSATFDIKDNISVNKEAESEEAHLYSSSDLINYKLILNCTHGGTAKDFSYYIPVPKTTSGTDSYMITTLDDIFNLDLQNAVTLSGDDLYDIYYTTKEGLNMSNVSLEDVVWLTESDVEDFSKVTMIKLLQKNSVIESGSSTTVSLNLMYGSEYFDEFAGKKFTYHSAGNYTYLLNGRETSGIFSTGGVSIDVNYEKSLPDITLTAAPNRSPLISGNVISYQLSAEDLPKFIKAQSLSISSVSTYNVTLNTKKYVNDNLDMEGIYANETFAITVSLNGGSEKDVLTSANDTPISIGTSSSNSSMALKYTIYNANNILENSNTRYIIITFISDNGVTIKQKININRETANATNPVSSIVSGNRYQLFDDTTSSISISKNASFTSQFVFDYIPDMYSNKYIVFEDNLPIGTTLTLYDYINDENPTYWYYIVSKATNKIELTEFKKMGFQNINYSYITGSTKYKEIYLLNVDFIDASVSDLDKNTVHLQMKGKSVDDVNSVDLSFLLNANRTFSIDVPDSISMGEDFEISMDNISSLGTESNYLGKKMAYVISAVGLPNDTYILYNQEKYYMNAFNKFIIPLDDVTGGNKNITLSFNTVMDSVKDNYDLTVDLMVTPNSLGINPLMGDVVASKSVVLNYPVRKMPSFKVESMSERVITKESLKEDKTIHLNYTSNGSSLIYVELQKKTGNSYQRVTDKLNRIAGITNHDMGVFNIKIADGEEDITFKLANTTDTGTYRFVFTIKDSDDYTYYEVPYTFIITD